MAKAKTQTNNYHIDINTVEEKKKTSDVPALVNKAELTITTTEGYEAAGAILKEIQDRYRELDKQRKAITGPIDQAKSAVMDLFRTPLTALENAGKKIKRLIKEYSDEQERKAEEERERLRKIAEKEAEAEKKKLEARIERAKASGKEEKAEELEAQKESITPLDVPVITSSVPKLKGVSSRENWTAEVIDFKALPDEYKLPNQSALNKVANATKGSIPIPGVKFHKDKIVAA